MGFFTCFATNFPDTRLSPACHRAFPRTAKLPGRTPRAGSGAALPSGRDEVGAAPGQAPAAGGPAELLAGSSLPGALSAAAEAVRSLSRPTSARPRSDHCVTPESNPGPGRGPAENRPPRGPSRKPARNPHPAPCSCASRFPALQPRRNGEFSRQLPESNEL